jgi:hypothetical protein
LGAFVLPVIFPKKRNPQEFSPNIPKYKLLYHLLVFPESCDTLITEANKASLADQTVKFT